MTEKTHDPEWVSKRKAVCEILRGEITEKILDSDLCAKDDWGICYGTIAIMKKEGR